MQSEPAHRSLGSEVQTACWGWGYADMGGMALSKIQLYSLSKIIITTIIITPMPGTPCRLSTALSAVVAGV